MSSRIISKALFLTIAMIFSASAFATDAEREYEKIINTVEKLFAYKTLEGEDGIVQEFGELERSIYPQLGAAMDATVTKPDGTTLEVTAVVYLLGDEILLEESVGGELAGTYRVRLRPSGNLLVSTLEEVTAGFISRECRLRYGKTVCHKKVRSSEGKLNIIEYKEISY